MIDLNNSAHVFLLGLTFILYGGAGFLFNKFIESSDDYTPTIVGIFIIFFITLIATITALFDTIIKAL